MSEAEVIEVSDDYSVGRHDFAEEVLAMCDAMTGQKREQLETCIRLLAKREMGLDTAPLPMSREAADAFNTAMASRRPTAPPAEPESEEVEASGGDVDHDRELRDLIFGQADPTGPGTPSPHGDNAAIEGADAE